MPVAHSPTVSSLRDRLEAFQPAIKKRDWSELDKDVAGLLPDLKQKMMSVTDQLELSDLPSADRILARAISTEVFIHLEKIDEADEVYNYQAVETNYVLVLLSGKTASPFILLTYSKTKLAL